MEENSTQREESGQPSGVNPNLAAAAAATLIPGLTGAAWIGLGYPVAIGLAWMGGLAALTLLTSAAGCRKDRDGRRDRRDFAKLSFLTTAVGSAGSGSALIIIPMIERMGD